LSWRHFLFPDGTHGNHVPRATRRAGPERTPCLALATHGPMAWFPWLSSESG
tara:strand:- start:40965 stop:41120 length:156 start_codon:yes stop_codon:yes gene_type:complete